MIRSFSVTIDKDQLEVIRKFLVILMISDLRGILVKFRMNIKGSKNELVERIIEGMTSLLNRDIFEEYQTISHFIERKYRDRLRFSVSDPKRWSKRTIPRLSETGLVYHVKGLSNNVKMFPDPCIELSVLLRTMEVGTRLVPQFNPVAPVGRMSVVFEFQMPETNPLNRYHVLIVFLDADTTPKCLRIPHRLVLNRINSNFESVPIKSSVMNITPYCSRHSNIVEMNYVSTKIRNCIEIVLARPLDADEQIQMVQRRISRSQGILTILQTFEEDNDLSTTQLTVSLICPLSLGRIKYAGKSLHCRHIQCFDILVLLRLMDGSRSGKCPICLIDISFEFLALDEYFQELVDKTSPENELVSIDPSCEWKSVPKSVVLPTFVIDNLEARDNP